jgi:hypothetical protein
MIGDSYIKQSELFQIIESNEKFVNALTYALRKMTN